MDCRFLRYVGVLVMIAATCSGCAMCDNSLDDAFGAYGGRWQRTDQFSGRVASVIDPAGVNVAGPPSDTSNEQPQVDDGQDSVLRPEATEELDQTNVEELLPEMTPGSEIDEPSTNPLREEPADRMESSPPADETESAPPIEEQTEEERGIEETMDDTMPETPKLPDFFKDLGLDTDPSLDSGSIEDLLPKDDDAGDQLPPLRPGAEQ